MTDPLYDRNQAPETLPLLEMKGVTHSYKAGSGGIFDISFAIAKGEFIILAGKNGSGKTTLIRHLNGLLTPGSGQVNLNGTSIFKDLVNTRKTVGMVFQDADTQIVGETVFDEVAFGPENLNLDREHINKTVTQTLTDLNLIQFKDRNPASLSGGEKRRLTIAGIMVMNPDIIIFDEPFANLDYPSSLSLVQQIQTLHQSGKTILMATHDVDLVIAHASRILVMDGGELKADGPPKKLAAQLETFGIKPCFTWFPNDETTQNKPEGPQH